ncbi:hypothetical protein ACFX16_036436 [Malus domestica]
MRDGAQWFVENTDIKLVGNDDPLQGEIAWNRTPRELGISAYALQQLGGSHAATSKQIRELMKVDGLTNDEVKSHLQFMPSRRASSAHVQYEDEVDDEDTITLLPQLLLVSAVLC